jgi:hypothetical protein
MVLFDSNMEKSNQKKVGLISKNVNEKYEDELWYISIIIILIQCKF